MKNLISIILSYTVLFDEYRIICPNYTVSLPIFLLLISDKTASNFNATTMNVGNIILFLFIPFYCYS